MRITMVALAVGCALAAEIAVAQKATGWPDLGRLAGVTGGGERDAAVVVGIERYGYVVPVAGAARNADDWHSWLTGSRKVPVERVRLLRNDEGTLEEIRKAVADTAAEVRPGGTLWFVFIGHGAPSQDGSDGVLVGADAQQKPASLYARSLSRRELLGLLAKGRQAQAVVLIDACFSGRTPGGEALATGLQPLIAVRGAAVTKGVVVLTAGRGNEFAGPLPGAERPAFSYLVLGALRGWAERDRGGSVTAAAAVAYARKAIKTLVKGREQTPEAQGETGLVLARGTEAGPDLAALARQSGDSELSFGGGITVNAPKIAVASVAGTLKDLNLEAERKLEAALDAEENKAAAPARKRAAWCALAEVTAKNPYLEKARAACAAWGEYAEARAKLEAAMNDDFPKLAGYLDLKRKTRAQKLAVVDAFLAAYRELAAEASYKQVAAARAKVAAGRAAQLGPAAAPTRAAATPASGSCPRGMVLVPAGRFVMGSPEGEGAADEHPQHRVTLSAYCMDRTEVTLGKYNACVQAGRCAPPPATVDWPGITEEQRTASSRFCNGPRPGRDRHPVNCVDWSMARAYCEWAGGRLPTEAEWEYAARGSEGRRYPWGAEAPGPRLLNACGAECVALGKRLGASWNSMYDGDDGAEDTAPVGSYPAGASPFGLLDMAGNVWEWVADCYGKYEAGETTDPTGPSPAGCGARVARGGGWDSHDASGVRRALRNRNTPTNRNNNLGSRCAKTVDPRRQSQGVRSRTLGQHGEGAGVTTHSPARSARALTGRRAPGAARRRAPRHAEPPPRRRGGARGRRPGT
jgi:formylglycine-generating enzyme required for sulfatase activity/uncharacterized caspase-like protein